MNVPLPPPPPTPIPIAATAILDARRRIVSAKLGYLRHVTAIVIATEVGLTKAGVLLHYVGSKEGAASIWP